MDNPFDDFFVRIGWDTTAYDKGAKDIEAGNKKVRDSSRSNANDMEASAKRAAASFRTVRNEVLGLFLAFQGASSIGGYLKDLIGDTANMGRVAANLNIPVGRLAGWEGAIQTVGGEAKDAANSLQLLVTAGQNLALTGTTGHDADFKRFGITGDDLKDPEKALLKIAKSGETMSKPEFFARLTRIGFSASTINLLEKGKDSVANLVDEQQRLAHVTDDDVKAAQEFTKAWQEASAAITGELRPALTGMLQDFTATIKLIKELGGLKGTISWVWDTLWNGNYGAKAPASPEAMKGLDSKITGGYKAGDPLGGGGSPGGGASVSGQYNRLLSRYGKPVADAIWHGIGAESGWNPSAFNKSGGGNGAYGLGQWRGTRLKALQAQYGPNPTAAQQIDFLISELEGGDPGGASVIGAKSYGEALSNYIGVTDGARSFGFMRPSVGGRAVDLRNAARLSGMRAPVNAGGGGGTTVNIQSMSVNTPNPENFIKKDLPGQLRRHGVILQNSSGMSQ